MNTKICKKCGKELPISEYQKHSGFKDGYHSKCKRCLSSKETPETIRCQSCGEVKPYFEFTKGKNSTGRSTFCKKCLSLYTSTQLRQFRCQLDNDFKEKLLKDKRESRKRNFIHATWKACQIRAKNKGIEFNIEESDIIIPDLCPILEVPFVLGSKDNYEYTPSIDRIDNSKGYIKGNIQIISKKANSMKNSATFEELTTFCKNILRYSPNSIKKEDTELQDKEPVG